LSLKTLYRKRTVIWPFYFYTIIRTLSEIITSILNSILKQEEIYLNNDIEQSSEFRKDIILK
ncbi:hypothetical protein K4S17_03730, partial [Staphylococcus epidermidis]|nr:hypothetical protein [Staphylococcus epidermidis]MCG1217914.1 hypothetical protein [Staphylococcus epidermidis]MCG1396100.1 hypothetical protein [Staphylococcus epidermidis]MCG2092299.1 hypothetical protein [Staphylococcus epidermidis]